MKRWRRLLWRAGWQAGLRLLTRLPLIALLACTLLALAPGFNADERSLDLRLSSQSILALRRAHRGIENPFRMGAAYLEALVRGDLGESTTYGAPVRSLMRDRWPVTLRSVLGGLLASWLLAGAIATLAALAQSRGAFAVAGVVTTVLICIPSALIGLIAMLLKGTVAWAMAGAIFPRVYQYAGRVLGRAACAPHVICGAGAGISRWRLFWLAEVRPALPELVAVGAASVGIALGAVVPLEVICDSPGLGQLAWKAALGRDVPLLLSVTLAMAAASNLCNSAADTIGEALGLRRA